MPERQRMGPPFIRQPAPHLLAPLWERAAAAPERPALAQRIGDRFEPQTVGALRERVRDIAGGLVDRGIRKGDHVALLSRTRMEWTQADLAILAAGAVTVPLYETSSKDQVSWILSDSGARIVIVETPEQRDLVQALADDLPQLEAVLAIEQGGLDALANAGVAHRDEVEQRVTSLDAETLATIVYSSGTTGSPKGCRLTHGNLCANARQTAQQVPELFTERARTLVFLPLAHAFARMQVITSLEKGTLVGFSTGLPQLREELALFQPTFLVAVPRVFEKILQGARRSAAEAGRGAIFDRAERVAVRRSTTARPGPGLRLLHAAFDQLVYRKIRATFGGQVAYAISGGSALPEQVGRFFAGIGIPVLEGYGLTEASPIVTGGPTEKVEPGTVGLPLPETTVAIDDDSEVLVSGPQVFGGYWGDDEATAAVLDDGWLRTGDLGRLEPTGHLRLTGRKKELIITAQGKNVVPTTLEDRLRLHPLISQAVVVGDDRPFIGALLTLDEEELVRRAADDAATRTTGTMRDPAEDPAVRAAVDEAVADANSLVSRAEQIRGYRILPGDLSVEQDELTPTLKLRRPVIAERYRDEIEALYVQAPPAP